MALSSDGSLAVVGATGQDGNGAAFVFVKNSNTYDEMAELAPPDPGSGDQFGNAVA